MAHTVKQLCVLQRAINSYHIFYRDASSEWVFREARSDVWYREASSDVWYRDAGSGRE